MVLADTARKAVYTLHYSGVFLECAWEGSRPLKELCQAASCWHSVCAQFGLPAPSTRPAHLPLGAGTGDQLAFDYVARFGVAVPILSFTALWNPGAAESEAGGGESPAVELHCVQTTAIQQYSLDPALCSEGSSAGGRGPDSSG